MAVEGCFSVFALDNAFALIEGHPKLFVQCLEANTSYISAADVRHPSDTVLQCVFCDGLSAWAGAEAADFASFRPQIVQKYRNTRLAGVAGVTTGFHALVSNF